MSASPKVPVGCARGTSRSVLLTHIDGTYRDGSGLPARTPATAEVSARASAVQGLSATNVLTRCSVGVWRWRGLAHLTFRGLNDATVIHAGRAPSAEYGRAKVIAIASSHAVSAVGTCPRCAVRGQSTTRLPDADIGYSQARRSVTRPSYSLRTVPTPVERSRLAGGPAPPQSAGRNQDPSADSATKRQTGGSVCRRQPARAPGGVMAARGSSHLAGDPQCSRTRLRDAGGRAG